jgi:hypothetical protein
MKHRIFIILFFFKTGFILAQTLGGSSVYNFLRLSNTPQLTALGGINISNQSNDVGLAFHNPSLLRPIMHTQANFVFNALYGDIKNLHFSFAYRNETLATNFAVGINYFNYGTITETDASGNVLGALKPTDYVIQVSASRNYLTRWFYGASLKYINSFYGMYRSSGIAADMGVSYYDSLAGIQGSLVVKNMGVQLKSYGGTDKEELPFDLQVGISKRLKNAPIQFSLTAQRLHRFDIEYNDTTFNNDNGVSQNNNNKKFTLDKLFRHFVVSTQVYVTEKVELSAGYNHLRRKELNSGNAGNGLNGFSMGVGILLKKLQLRYARSYYQNNRSYHQLGLNLRLNEYFGLGQFGEKIGW